MRVVLGAPRYALSSARAERCLRHGQTPSWICRVRKYPIRRSQNAQVNSYVVKDLNEDPTLPFEDNSFDVVTNVVDSVEISCRGCLPSLDEVAPHSGGEH